jgi:soluble lytic murein transglycosylase-like protein
MDATDTPIAHMETRKIMKFLLSHRFRTFKLAALTTLALFLFTDLTGLLVTHAFAPTDAPTEEARSVVMLAEELPREIPTSGNSEIDRLIIEAAAKYGVDPRFIHAVIWQESKYKTSARSHVGAQGLMQLMPETAKRFGCKNIAANEDNIDAGTRYLRWLIERFSGDVSRALAGYNAGEGAVDKYDGIPPYSETRNYVRNIEAQYGKTFHPVLDPAVALAEFQVPQQGVKGTN